ncbi:MAG: hypothetical protein MJ173_05450 [Clostridia bacterium]|nr:hypothetical protein [Clostridia bacterium]
MCKVENIQYKYLCGAVDLFNAGTNEFTGSLPARDGSKGIFSNEFRYKVIVYAEDKTPLKVVASYYWGWQCFAAADDSLITTKDFEASVEGTAEACAWLQSEYDNYRRN